VSADHVWHIVLDTVDLFHKHGPKHLLGDLFIQKEMTDDKIFVYVTIVRLGAI